MEHEERGITVSAEWWNKVKQFVGIPMEEEFEMPESQSVGTMVMEEELPSFASPSPPKQRQRERQVTGINQMVGIQSTLTQSEVMIMEPKSFDDARDIVMSLRERRSVIMNMKALTGEQAQRLLDFVSGATHALDGHQKQIGEGIFLFSPSNVVINPLGAEQPWLNRDARDLFWRVK